MAAAPTADTVKITINDVQLDVPKGELIVESVKRLGLEIPIFCYHARLKPVGMCRMCLVEVGFKQDDGSVRKMPKPQAACTLPAGDGMVIYTDSEQVHKDRKGVLEFLLVNHPLDCPICDRGGECPLQNNTLEYGPSTSRFIEMKRHAPKAFPLSKYVTLDLERCIQCGRCVRFTEEISGDAQLAFRFRGASMQPTTYQLTDFDSKFSGNVIEICPVGALTSAEYRFRARPWDLETAPSVCTECSNGCNVWFDHRAGKFVRLNGRTNEAVNEEWTCDKGKFGHDWYNADERLDAVMKREGDRLVAAGWAEAHDIISSNFNSDSAGLVKPRVSNEALYLFGKMFDDVFESPHVDSRFTEDLSVTAGAELAPTAIADLESKKTVVIFGTPLADELPMVYLRLRKAAVNNGVQVVNITEQPTDADQFATVSIRVDNLADAANKVAGDLTGMLKAAGVADARAAEIAAGAAEAGAILSSENLLNKHGGKAAFDALKGGATPFNCYSVNACGQGARELGIIPRSGGKNTNEILHAAAEGKLNALWLVGCDPIEDFHDKELAIKALENVEFLVVQNDRMTEAAHYASLLLPMCAPAEQEGTFTNCERRVQRLSPVIKSRGEAKPSWRIFNEVLLRSSGSAPYFNPKEVMAAIAEENPDFGSVTEEALAGECAVLGTNQPSEVSHA